MVYNKNNFPKDKQIISEAIWTQRQYFNHFTITNYLRLAKTKRILAPLALINSSFMVVCEWFMCSSLNDSSLKRKYTNFFNISDTYILQTGTTQALDFLVASVFNIPDFGGFMSLVETDTEFVAYCHFGWKILKGKINIKS